MTLLELDATGTAGTVGVFSKSSSTSIVFDVDQGMRGRFGSRDGSVVTASRSDVNCFRWFALPSGKSFGAT